MIINNYIPKLKDRFAGYKTISKDELLQFFREWEPDLKETTFRWRVYELKQQGILQNIGRSSYTLNAKPSFIISASTNGIRVYKRIIQYYPGIKACVWNTTDLHDLMLHQPAHSMDILEIEATAIELVWDRFWEFDSKSFPMPSHHKSFDYFNNHNSAIPQFYIRRLLTRAPIHVLEKEGYVVPTLEKILVDIFCDPEFFSTFAGSELSFMLNTAYHKFAIDFAKLLGYSKRRNKLNEMKELILSTTDIPPKLIK